MRLRPVLARFSADRRGTVAIIGAIGTMTLAGFCAVGVDLGSVFMDTRRLQGAADLAAMAAARDLDNAQAAAEATARDNGWTGPLTVTIEKGQYRSDGALAVGARFTPGGGAPDAVRVRLSSESPLFFGQALLGKPTMTINRSATAARAELASFSIGTRLAALNGGLANALLAGLTGSQVNLSVMDYQALATANVDLFEYFDALRLDLDLKAASYDKVLDAELTSGRALTVLAKVLEDGGEIRAATATAALARAAGNRTPVDLHRLFDPGPYAPQSHVAGASSAAVKVDAISLAKATLALAGGERQVALDLGAAVPGVTSLKAWLAIGEPPNNAPWMTITASRDVIIRTAQTRLYLEAKLGGSGLLQPAQLKLPLLVEAASGEARLNAMACESGAATLDVRPGLGGLTIGEINTAKLDDFKTALAPTTATLASAPLFSVKGKSAVSLGGQTWQPVRFAASDIQNGVVKTVSTTDIAQATVSSLLNNLTLSATVGGLNLGLTDTTLTSAVSAALTPLAPSLDEVLNTLTGLVGVRLGQADVRMNGLRCRDAALVA